MKKEYKILKTDNEIELEDLQEQGWVVVEAKLQEWKDLICPDPEIGTPIIGVFLMCREVKKQEKEYKGVLK